MNMRIDFEAEKYKFLTVARLRMEINSVWRSFPELYPIDQIITLVENGFYNCMKFWKIAEKELTDEIKAFILIELFFIRQVNRERLCQCDVKGLKDSHV